MQRMTVIAVGKAAEFYAAGVAEYGKRMQGMCHFEVKEVAEEPLREKNASAAQVDATLEKEGKRILAAVPKGAKLVALCVEGKGCTTPELASLLAGMAVNGEGNIAFAIGGSHGLSPQVKSSAALRLSLSALTMPHQLARLVLTEQLYRVMMMQAGRTYHK